MYDQEESQEEDAVDLLKKERQKLGEIKAEASKMPATQLVGKVELAYGYTDDQGNAHRAVLLSQMTARHVASLVTGGQFDKDRLLYVLAECCESFGTYHKDTDAAVIRDILYHKLLLCEQFQLIVMLRQLSLGTTYEYSATCPKCKHKADYQMPLGELEIIGTVEGDPDDRHLVWTDLADRKWEIAWRYGRAGDDQWLTRLLEQWNKQYNKLDPKRREREFDPQDLNVFTALFLSRVTAIRPPSSPRHILKPRAHKQEEGDVLVSDLINYVLNLPQDLLTDFAYSVDEEEPSLDSKIEFQCESCAAKMEVPLMVASASFFSRSSRSSRIKAR
jgi:hypothetical protein